MYLRIKNLKIGSTILIQGPDENELINFKNCLKHILRVCKDLVYEKEIYRIENECSIMVKI